MHENMLSNEPTSVKGQVPKNKEVSGTTMSSDIISQKQWVKTVESIQFGLAFTEGHLFPLTNHKKAWLFDSDKMKEYAESNLLVVHSEGPERIYGSTLDDFSEVFALTMGGDRRLATAMAPVSRAEVECVHQTEFLQTRTQTCCMRIQLPLPEADSRDEIRNLLIDDVKRRLDRIDNEQDATDFLQVCGFVYVQTAFLGESQVATHVSREPSKPMQLLANCWRGFARSSKIAEQESCARKRGEKKSHSIPSPSIIQCQFKPIHNLARAASKAEKYLKQAYENYFAPIKDDTLYFVQNVANGNWMTSDFRETEAERTDIIRVVIGELRRHERQERVMVGFLDNEKDLLVGRHKQWWFQGALLKYSLEERVRQAQKPMDFAACS